MVGNCCICCTNWCFYLGLFLDRILTGLTHFSPSHVREKFFKKHVELLKSLPVRGVTERKGFCISEWVMWSKRKLLCFLIFPCGTRVVYFQRIYMVEISSLHWWTWAIFGGEPHVFHCVCAYLVGLCFILFVHFSTPQHQLVVRHMWIFSLDN